MATATLNSHTILSPNSKEGRNLIRAWQAAPEDETLKNEVGEMLLPAATRIAEVLRSTINLRAKWAYDPGDIAQEALLRIVSDPMCINPNGSSITNFLNKVIANIIQDINRSQKRIKRGGKLNRIDYGGELDHLPSMECPPADKMADRETMEHLQAEMPAVYKRIIDTFTGNPTATELEIADWSGSSLQQVKRAKRRLRNEWPEISR